MTPSEAQDRATEIVHANPSEPTLSVPREVLAELAFMPTPIEDEHFIVYPRDAPTLLYVGDGAIRHLDHSDPSFGMDERTEALVVALLDLAQRRLMRARIEREQDMYPPVNTTP